jgi:hypothetical protein
MVKRIACFLTCGYTEAGAMQYFLKKINSSFEYKQYLPNRTIKKKGDSKNISSSISGLTGEALLEKVYSIIKNHTKEILECAAIIIEDDLDDKFVGWSDEKINKFIKNIKNKIYGILGCEIPIFIMYAAPEVESWFIADWENGFKFLYCKGSFINDVNINARIFFTHHLKRYIEIEILKEYSSNIEIYGVFDGKYYKLSEQLVKAIQYDSKEYINKLTGTNKDFVNQILNSRSLYYSKKLHGDMMLRNISPENVAKGCCSYFKSTYNELREFAI